VSPTRRGLASILFVALLLCTAAVAEACPGCKDALAANDSQQYQIARGYFWSILFMLSMPLLIAGTFGSYVYIELRRARRDREQLAQDEPQGDKATDQRAVVSS